MRTIITAFFTAACTLAWNVPSTAGGTEKRVSLDDVPAAVRMTADKAIPGAKWNKAEIETKQGQTIYEIKGKGTEKDRNVEAEVTADGKLVKVEVEVPYDEVPDVVRNTLKTRHPKFKPTEVEAVTSEGKAGGYEFEGREGMLGKKLEIFVSGDGQTVEVDEDED